eukprot:TRINITY_DN2686_c0_g2_i1.p1 TRINITY_DN2686_c0_g2~~TRINITY_DN2686_c0_g2_i1.p1  ORF type:complete len:445 (-),score=85.49 TRINITY_DN2686_c0_g2_i1:133-1467(-)
MTTLVDIAVMSDRVRYLSDLADRDPVWADFIEAKLRQWLSHMIEQGVLVPLSGTASIELPSAGGAEETHALRKNVLSLQDAIPCQKSEADDEFFFVFKNLPIYWTISELTLALRHANIVHIGAIEMSVSGPGSALVRVRSEVEASMCLALNGLLLPHVTGAWPVEVHQLSSAAPLPAVEASGPGADPLASDVCIEEVVAPRLRASGAHRKGARSATSPAARTTDRSSGAHRKAARSKSRGPMWQRKVAAEHEEENEEEKEDAAMSKSRGPEWQRKGTLEQEEDGVVVAVFDEEVAVDAAEAAVARQNAGIDNDVLAGKIREQVEYYFSDDNLRHDKFLQQLAEQGKDGFVPIRVLLTFNKIKCLTTDSSTLASALCGSSMLLVSEDGMGVKVRPRINQDRLLELLLAENTHAEKVHLEAKMSDLLEEAKMSDLLESLLIGDKGM